jgi:hypothetical protein
LCENVKNVLVFIVTAHFDRRGVRK